MAAFLYFCVQTSGSAASVATMSSQRKGKVIFHPQIAPVMKACEFSRSS